MLLVVGEVLYDVFPDARRIGGAPFNFAFHLVQMGFEVKFLTRVGEDEERDSLRDFMQRSGFDLTYVQNDKVHKTGKVMVYPDPAGGHRFDIVRDAAYDYIAFTDAIEQLLRTPPKLIYFGTLVQRTLTGRQTMERILRSCSPETVVFYDINLRPGCYSRSIVRQSLLYTDILKLNDEELGVIAEMFDLSGDTAARVARLIKDYGLSLVALTKGDRGSEMFTPDAHIEMPLSQNVECVDTVGAGDAFAAVMAAGYLKNRDIRQTLSAATAFAGRICGIPGAVPASGDFYDQMKI